MTVRSKGKPMTVHHKAARPWAYRLALATMAICVCMLETGCSTPPRAEITAHHRPEIDLRSYKVFFINAVEQVHSSSSDLDLRSTRTLEVVRSAIIHELKERGLAATADPSSRDIDALVTFGFSVSSESGTNISSTPGSVYSVKGATYAIGGMTTAARYAYDTHIVWVEIFDLRELRSSNYELDRVRPAWRGTIKYRASGNNGISRDEAETMALNLLAEFPTPQEGVAPLRTIVLSKDRATHSVSQGGR